MTEKRFEIREEDIIVEYHELEGLHTCIRNNGEFMTYQELVDLLNEQHKEIQRLEKQLRIFSDGLRAEIRETKEVMEDWSECIDEKKQLKDENEQLQKDVEYWKQIAIQYNNELNVFEHCKKYKTECKDIHWSSD